MKNSEMAVIQKNDPARLRTRTVESEGRKARHSRARRKDAWRKEMRA
jgi:hypothetical protein